MKQDLGFKSAVERFKTEESERKRLAARMLPFGINFLDKVLGGILPTDLVLIGAKTGIGKTEIATTIAKEVVMRGKRVHYFALEAEKSEIERRTKYQILTALYFEDPNKDMFITPNYLDWYLGKYDKVFAKYVDESNALVHALENLYTYYRTGDFDVKEFERIAFALNESTDLIVVDHIHYFDFEGKNENKELTDTIKHIRDLVLIMEIPVILLAHVRKSDKRNSQLIPDSEELHGSSNLGKIATKTVFLAPGSPIGANLYETYFKVDKARIDGSRARYAGRGIYNSSLNRYEKTFDFGRITPDGKSFEPFDQTNPELAKLIPAWLKEK